MKSRISLTTFSDDTKKKAEKLRQLKKDYHRTKDADGFVLKSAPQSELFAAIEAILAGDTYVQQTLVAPLFTYKSVFDGLTRQEQTVFKKLIERKSRSQITKELNIVERSLENYLSKIYQKTG